MNRFKRIATRGWLGRSLSIATFGYFPYTENVIADWCVSDAALQDWTTADVPIHDWILADAAHTWTVSDALTDAITSVWSATDTALNTWTAADMTRDC